MVDSAHHVWAFCQKIVYPIAGFAQPMMAGSARPTGTDFSGPFLKLRHQGVAARAFSVKVQA
jgi:hypothetical protein